MVVTLMLRLHPDRLAAGELAGHAELVASGRRARVDSTADLLRFARAEAGPTPRPGTADPLRALGLTGRQAEVLALLAEGRTTGQIAEALGVSRPTVYKHVEHVRRRLGVVNRPGCVAVAHAAWAAARTAA